MARKKQAPASAEDKELIGAILRGLRRAAGFRSVELAAARSDCPAAMATIYSYERGDLTPSLTQYLELVEFYVLGGGPRPEGAKPETDLRADGVVAVTRALRLRAYHVVDAQDLVDRLQPDPRRLS
ncbi:MAG: hypothetical protein ABI572_08900 [Actinomycetota bacterium]